ncbi:hypothetical protein GINT2_001623 [Glugoides intestinalis]
MKELNSLSRNCIATDKFIKNENKKLVNLVAIFRHGDRAPLNIHNEIWKTKSCIVCSTICKSLPCTNGMLTKKGYLQSKNLGEFIRKSYIKYFDKIEGVFGFYSSLNRSFSTLHGVLASLELSTSNILEEDSIISDKNSILLKKVILNNAGIKPQKNTAYSYGIYDDIISSYCSETPYDCENFSCNPNKILSFVESQEKIFKDSMADVSSSFAATGVTLGSFSPFLKKELERRNSISLVSGHDSTIIRILAALNISLETLPPYAGTVFIEVWRHANGKEYVRIVYQGKSYSLSDSGKDYVSFESFARYLDIFSYTNKTLSEEFVGLEASTDKDAKKPAGDMIKTYQSLEELIEKANQGYITVEAKNMLKNKKNDFGLLSINSLLFGSDNIDKDENKLALKSFLASDCTDCKAKKENPSSLENKPKECGCPSAAKECGCSSVVNQPEPVAITCPCEKKPEPVATTCPCEKKSEPVATTCPCEKKPACMQKEKPCGCQKQQLESFFSKEDTCYANFDNNYNYRQWDKNNRIINIGDSCTGNVSPGVWILN